VWSYRLDDPSTYDTPDELAVAIADARCEIALRCEWDTAPCSPLAIEPAARYVRDVDSAVAHDCLQRITGSRCEVRDRDACDVLAIPGHGLAPPGAACGAGQACAHGDCSSSAASCDGTCPTNFDCHDVCPATAYCEPRTGACVPLPALGEPCALCVGVGGFPCVVGECASGLACDPLMGTCATAPVEGGPCASEPDPLGGGTYDWCGHDLYCEPSSRTCVALRFAAVGEACDDGVWCADDARCIGHVCAALPRAGEACIHVVDRPCAPGFSCNASDRCVARVGPGCACDDDRTTACVDGYACDAGACAPLPATCISSAPVGGACHADADCAPPATCEAHHCRIAGNACYTPPA
jgi:hypothetical protein